MGQYEIGRAPMTSGARWMRTPAQLDAALREREWAEQSITDAIDRADIDEGERLVYAIQAIRDEAPGPFKIGFARSADHLRKRIRDLQRSSADQLIVRRVLDGSPATERGFHERFREHWLRGEWFRWAPELEEWANA